MSRTKELNFSAFPIFRNKPRRFLVQYLEAAWGRLVRSQSNPKGVQPVIVFSQVENVADIFADLEVAHDSIESVLPRPGGDGHLHCDDFWLHRSVMTTGVFCGDDRRSAITLILDEILVVRPFVSKL